jgi:hypothetical protein
VAQRFRRSCSQSDRWRTCIASQRKIAGRAATLLSDQFHSSAASLPFYRIVESRASENVQGGAI